MFNDNIFNIKEKIKKKQLTERNLYSQKVRNDY